ncbi:hypothetical protein L195_g061183, partial [Trifolium pratense]
RGQRLEAADAAGLASDLISKAARSQQRGGGGQILPVPSAFRGGRKFRRWPSRFRDGEESYWV